MPPATFIAMSDAFGTSCNTLKGPMRSVLKPLLPSWSRRVDETARNLFAAQQAAWSGHLTDLSTVGVGEASREATASDLQAVSGMLKADAVNACNLLKELHDHVADRFGRGITDDLLPPLAQAIAALESIYKDPTA
ncbi:hypothetical protein [Stenotrophomonas sp. 9(2022)]|uniref:hypothetical protein n=1 Tax=Stenotrophomonas sp. 9(2022) TaxID=2950153 RepID=UPI002114E1E9|nr:hypothetical protein [Stenotrophomonas sp. 9(2022)]